MPRVKRGVASRARRKKVRCGQRVLRCPQPLVQGRQAGGHQGGAICLPRPSPAQASVRALWIIRINAAANELGLSYSRLINGLHLAGIEVDRKVLADLAMHEKDAFAALVAQAKAALEGEVAAAA